MVWTLLDTGLRVAELAGLTREGVDSSNHTLYARSSGRRRGVRLTPRVEAALLSRFRYFEWLGLGARTIQRVLREVAARAGLEGKLCAETLRRTFAVSAIWAGKTPLELAALLGLRHAAATELYFELARARAAGAPGEAVADQKMQSSAWGGRPESEYVPVLAHFVALNR